MKRGINQIETEDYLNNNNKKAKYNDDNDENNHHHLVGTTTTSSENNNNNNNNNNEEEDAEEDVEDWDDENNNNNNNQIIMMTRCGILPYLYREDRRAREHELYDVKITVGGGSGGGSSSSSQDDNDDDDNGEEREPEEEISASEALGKCQGPDGSIHWNTVLKKYSNQFDSFTPYMQHGDVVSTYDYRRCGCYIVYQPFPNDGDDIILIPTLTEYGYALPFEFSDAPLDYYMDCELPSRFVHTDYVWPKTEIIAIVKVNLTYNNNKNKSRRRKEESLFGLFDNHMTVDHWYSKPDGCDVCQMDLDCLKQRFNQMRRCVRRMSFEFMLPLLIQLNLTGDLIQIITHYLV